MKQPPFTTLSLHQKQKKPWHQYLCWFEDLVSFVDESSDLGSWGREEDKRQRHDELITDAQVNRIISGILATLIFLQLLPMQNLHCSQVVHNGASGRIRQTIHVQLFSPSVGNWDSFL